MMDIRSDDGTCGPEWEKMVARHKATGVINWHISARDGATCEAVAAEVNRIDEWLSCPYNNLSGRLRGEAFCLRDGAREQVQVADGGFIPIKYTETEKCQMRRDNEIADLLIEAAKLLEKHGKPMETHHA